MDIATSQKRVCDMGLGKGICQALGRVEWVHRKGWGGIVVRA